MESKNLKVRKWYWQCETAGRRSAWALAEPGDPATYWPIQPAREKMRRAERTQTRWQLSQTAVPLAARDDTVGGGGALELARGPGRGRTPEPRKETRPRITKCAIATCTLATVLNSTAIDPTVGQCRVPTLFFMSNLFSFIYYPNWKESGIVRIELIYWRYTSNISIYLQNDIT